MAGSGTRLCPVVPRYCDSLREKHRFPQTPRRLRLSFPARSRAPRVRRAATSAPPASPGHLPPRPAHSPRSPAELGPRGPGLRLWAPSTPVLPASSGAQHERSAWLPARGGSCAFPAPTRGAPLARPPSCLQFRPGRPGGGRATREWSASWVRQGGRPRPLLPLPARRWQRRTSAWNRRLGQEGLRRRAGGAAGTCGRVRKGVGLPSRRVPLPGGRTPQNRLSNNRDLSPEGCFAGLFVACRK